MFLRRVIVRVDLEPSLGNELTTPPPSASAPSSARDLLGSITPRRAVDASDLAVIRTPRLELRPLLPDDRGAFLDAVKASRTELDQWSMLHRVGESDDQLFDRQLLLARAGEAHANALRRVAWLEGRVAGAFNLNAITRGLQFEADANWWVRTDLTGRGIGTEGLRTLLEIAFTELPTGLGLHRVSAGIRPDNAASRKIAERLGFQRRSTGRSSFSLGGHWECHDLYVHDVLDGLPTASNVEAATRTVGHALSHPAHTPDAPSAPGQGRSR